MLICFSGLLFVALTLPKALRKENRQNNEFEGDDIFPITNDVKSRRSCWEKDPYYSPLARDRLEVLESWEKCNNDPRLPAPIPPTKPHPYFGDESGPDRID